MNRLPGLVLRMECTELDAIFEWVLPFYIRNPERIPEKLLIRVFGIFQLGTRTAPRKNPPPRDLTRKEDSLNNKSNKKFLF